MSVADLPLFNACINACVFVLLIVGYVLIRRKNREAHKWVMLAAVTLSAIFLASYVTYHAKHGATRFTGQGFVRPVYFTILVSHTILAIGNLPFVIVTLTRALKRQFAAHARVAKRTWAIWLYVAATGPIVYVMLYQMYPTVAEKFQAARKLHHDQKDREALAAYEEAAALGSVEARCYAAVLKDRLAETNTASIGIALALKDEPANVHCRVLQARDLVFADRSTEAIPILEDAVKRAPDDPFFWASLGFAEFRAEKYAAAAAAFEKSATLDPTLAGNVFNAGYAYYLEGKYSQAKPLIEKALAMNNLDADSRDLAKETLEVITGALWVCPMHPDQSGKAGDKCPICGMPLEPAPHGIGEEDEQ